MQDYTERFPGNIILRNGTKYREQIHVIPDAVVMTIKSLDRSKRDLEVPDIPTYWLHPAPVVMSEAQLTILSMDDLEVGQQILLDDSQESLSIQVNSNRTDEGVTLSSVTLGILKTSIIYSRSVYSKRLTIEGQR